MRVHNTQHTPGLILERELSCRLQSLFIVLSNCTLRAVDPLRQVPYTFYVQDTEVMESLVQTVSELGESNVIRNGSIPKCIAHYRCALCTWFPRFTHRLVGPIVLLTIVQ